MHKKGIKSFYKARFRTCSGQCNEDICILYICLLYFSHKIVYYLLLRKVILDHVKF